MRILRFPLLAFALITGLFLCHDALAAPHRSAAGRHPALSVSKVNAREYMPTSELRPGMKGYGLTVFKGTKIERFDVTILGVLKKVQYGRDLILVRLNGGPVTKRYANIIAGMSGSPVYINGRLVGAVSYGIPFAREPLGFLTPIQDMLEAWDPDLPQIASAGGLSASGDTGPAIPASLMIDGRHVTGIRLAAPGTGAFAISAGGTLTLTPLMTPLTVTGVSASRLPALAKLLAPLGLRPSQAGSAVPPAGTQGSAMIPGGAVGVSLATGDLDMTAIGTLTYRRGNKVVAFGHPYAVQPTGIGPLDAPMFSAYIHDILPSYQSSEKVGSAVRLVGRIFQDRPSAIGGEIGGKPRMVPIALDIEDRSIKRTRHFRAQVVRHPLITGQLAAFAASNAIFELHGQPGDASRHGVQVSRVGREQGRDGPEMKRVVQESTGILGPQRALGGGGKPKPAHYRSDHQDRGGEHSVAAPQCGEATAAKTREDGGRGD